GWEEVLCKVLEQRDRILIEVFRYERIMPERMYHRGDGTTTADLFGYGHGRLKFFLEWKSFGNNFSILPRMESCRLFVGTQL
ncbi:hypothetical protein HAX54_013995, partial [Datura stramonium]|nr:hypothetical protein [Datura stramonium]